MPQGFGRQVSPTKIVAPLELMVSGYALPDLWKVGGVTLDWATVVAVSGSPVTLNDGLVIPIGVKYLRYGTPIALITKGQVVTVTEASGGSGDTFTVTAQVDTDPAQTTAAVAYNATGATLQTAMRLLTNLGTDVGVTGGAGGPYVMAFTGALVRRHVTITTTVTSTNGMTLTNADTETFDEYGAYGPADSGASDGRQTWTAGRFFLLNTTVVDPSSPFGIANPNNTIIGAVQAGDVWQARLNVGGSGQPALSDVLAKLPGIRLHYGL